LWLACVMRSPNRNRAAPRDHSPSVSNHDLGSSDCRTILNKGAPSGRIVKRNGDGYRGCLQTLLHDPMAPALAHSGESVLFENATNLRA
jgi:hypothetical protein